MRTIFSFGVMAAIVYLTVTEVPQVGAWFDNHDQGKAGAAVGELLRPVVENGAEKQTTGTPHAGNQVAEKQLSETQSAHIIARVAKDRQRALESMRQEIHELREQLAQQNPQADTAPYSARQRRRPPQQSGERVDSGARVEPAAAVPGNATGNTPRAYMSTEDRRRELLQMAQRLELRSLGIEE